MQWNFKHLSYSKGSQIGAQMSSGAFRMTQDSHTWVVVVAGVEFAQVPCWAEVGGIRAYLPWTSMQPQEFIPWVPKEERASGCQGPAVTWGPGWVTAVPVPRVSEASPVRSRSVGGWGRPRHSGHPGAGQTCHTLRFVLFVLFFFLFLRVSSVEDFFRLSPRPVKSPTV